MTAIIVTSVVLGFACGFLMGGALAQYSVLRGLALKDPKLLYLLAVEKYRVEAEEE